ncbi:MAG: polysaccharide pyruvyl transferase CsaB [Cyanobacteria bacterium P01_H01_bin.74]
MNETPPLPAAAPRKKKKRSKAPLYPTVVISGYYGFDNLGDELILRVLLTHLKQRKIHCIVLSNQPHQTSIHYGVMAIARTDVIEIVRALSKANLLISGGGGLFQDVTSMKSPLYYGALIHLARFLNVPVCFWGQGVGPLNKKLSQMVFRSSLLNCQSVLVRDEKSAQLTETLSGLSPQVSADPVWLLNLTPLLSKQTSHSTKTLKNNDPSKNFKLGVSLRPWDTLTDSALAGLSKTVQYLTESHTVELVLLPFQPQDMGVLEQFQNRYQSCCPADSIRLVPPAEVLSTITTCDGLIGMRFHSVVLALLLNIPVVGIAYDPKVSTLLESFSLACVSVEMLTEPAKELNAQVLEGLSAQPNADLTLLRAKATLNTIALDGLLNLSQEELAR